MELNERRNAEYNYSFQVKNSCDHFTSDEVVRSYGNGFKDSIEMDGNLGLRKPQYGALSSIRANWTINDDAITIVLPTGTGKSETMLAAIVSEKIKRTLIIVPNKLLRDQTYERARRWGILKDIGCVDDSVLYPNTLCLKSSFKDIKNFKSMIENSNIIISTMQLINKMSENQINIISTKCDLLVVDEAHHISSKTWRSFKKQFLKKKFFSLQQHLIGRMGSWLMAR